MWLELKMSALWRQDGYKISLLFFHTMLIRGKRHSRKKRELLHTIVPVPMYLSSQGVGDIQIRFLFHCLGLCAATAWHPEGMLTEVGTN